MVRYIQIAFSAISSLVRIAIGVFWIVVGASQYIGLAGLPEDIETLWGLLDYMGDYGGWILILVGVISLTYPQWWTLAKNLARREVREDATEHEKASNLQENDPDLETVRSFLNEAQKRIGVVLEDPKNRRNMIAFSFDLDTKIYPFLKEAFTPPRDQDLKYLIKRGREERDTLSPKFDEPASTKSFLEKLNNEITKVDLNSEFTPPPSFNEFSGDDVG